MTEILLLLLYVAVFLAALLSLYVYAKRKTGNFWVLHDGLLMRSDDLEPLRLGTIIDRFKPRVLVSLSGTSTELLEQCQSWGVTYYSVPMDSCLLSMDYKIAKLTNIVDKFAFKKVYFTGRPEWVSLACAVYRRRIHKMSDAECWTMFVPVYGGAWRGHHRAFDYFDHYLKTKD
jgi:hypothetical protein